MKWQQRPTPKPTPQTKTNTKTKTNGCYSNQGESRLDSADAGSTPARSTYDAAHPPRREHEIEMRLDTQTAVTDSLKRSIRVLRSAEHKTRTADTVNLSMQGCAPLAATAQSLCTWQDREPRSPARAYVCTLRFGNSTTFAASCRRSTLHYANAAHDAVGLAARIPERPRWSRNQPVYWAGENPTLSPPA
jgi:hypothetical protein